MDGYLISQSDSSMRRPARSTFEEIRWHQLRADARFFGNLLLVNGWNATASFKLPGINLLFEGLVAAPEFGLNVA